MIARGQAASKRGIIAPACYIKNGIGAAHHRTEL
jgi:hypothetical protein